MSRNKIIIAPSLLAANPGEFSNEILTVRKQGADWLHLDVMDGSFVPEITFGTNIVKLARQLSDIFLDVHLMIVNPEKHIANFATAGANLITIHIEACAKPSDALHKIKDLGLKAGLAIKPNTEWCLVTPYLQLCDLVLVMTVEPGKGGQAFMPDMLNKIQELKKIVDEKKLTTRIEVDGGINATTAQACINAGADTLVAGSYIFNSADRTQAITSLRIW